MAKRDTRELACEAIARAQNIKGNLSEKIEIAALTLSSKLPFKALSLREVLLHRFADLSSCAASALESKKPVSAGTLTRGCMETLARSFELSSTLDATTKNSDLEALDNFLMNRLFGSRDGGENWPEAKNILYSIDKMDKLGIRYRENYDRLSELAHPNYDGGLGAFQRIDRENFTVFFGEAETSEASLNMIGHLLIGTQAGFEHIYNELEEPIRRLNDAFEAGTLKH